MIYHSLGSPEADKEMKFSLQVRLLLGRKVMTNLDSILKHRDITFLTKAFDKSQSCGFSSSHVWMWELDYKECWALKNWCFWTVVLEKTLESSLDCKEIQPVHPKGNQSWIFIGRTDAEAEAPILWPPDAKNWLIGKDPDAGKDWRREEKGTTEDEMDGWHHQLDGHEFEHALRVGDGQGSLACCIPWGCKESDMTEWLNWTELNLQDICQGSMHVEGRWKKNWADGEVQLSFRPYKASVNPSLQSCSPKSQHNRASTSSSRRLDQSWSMRLPQKGLPLCALLHWPWPRAAISRGGLLTTGQHVLPWREIWVALHLVYNEADHQKPYEIKV